MRGRNARSVRDLRSARGAGRRLGTSQDNWLDGLKGIVSWQVESNLNTTRRYPAKKLGQRFQSAYLTAVSFSHCNSGPEQD